MKNKLLKLLHISIFLSSSIYSQQNQLPPVNSPVIETRKASGKISVDGKLNEADWQDATPISSFKQVEPYQGTDAKKVTTVKIIFDEKQLYVGVFAKDSNTRKTIRVPSLNRDFTFEDNDLFGVAIDAFNNKRNSVAFQVTPYGTQRDLQSFDDALFDTDWDALWYAKTSITDTGWYAEIAIPFQSIRYPAGPSDWGINFIRIHRSSNEITAFPGYPRSFDTYRMVYTAILRGIEVPRAGMNLRINPYVLQQANRITENSKAIDVYKTKVGGDLKWAISQHAVLDATLNTDFAQADVDRQVVNLSRFSVYFPEKRQFFLENSGLMLTGDGENIEPFFSRRIGLDDDGHPIPLIGGAKYTDRTAKRSIGALYALQDGHDSIEKINFTALRYIHNYGSANNIGVLLTNKYSSSTNFNSVASINGIHRIGEGWRYKYLWSHSFDKNDLTTADTNKPLTTKGYGGNINIDYESNRLSFYSNHSLVSETYLPGMGFISRSNLLTHTTGIIPILRPAWKPSFMRSFQPGMFLTFSERASDLKMQEGVWSIYPFYFFFNDGSLISLRYTYNWQLLTEDLPFLSTEVNKGDYYFHRYKLSFNSDLSRKISIIGSAETGGYYHGELSTFKAELKISPIPHISFINTIEWNAFKNFGNNNNNFNTSLFTSTLRLALNANVQLISFYQYNSILNSSRVNVRFSWQYKPLSFIYLVFNSNDFQGIQEQQGIFKINFLKQIR